MYFGIFEKMQQLDNNYEVQSFYQNHFAYLYDMLTKEVNYDLQFYGKYAELYGSDILELACGSGRILMYFANKGFDISGIDLSEDMLNVLGVKLSQQPINVQSRIKLYCADMKDFSLDKLFSLILLPATSITLLKNYSEIEMLFKTVHKHLTKDGRFIFDCCDNNSVATPIVYSPIVNWTDTTPEGDQLFAIFQERKDFLESKAIVNCYLEVKSNGNTKRLFSYSEKTILNCYLLQEIIEKTGFQIVEIKELDSYENEKLKLVALGKI